jgi:hypothetical protein
VGEAGGGLGLANEAQAVVGVVGVEELEGDGAIEIGLPGLVDGAEAAAARTLVGVEAWSRGVAEEGGVAGAPASASARACSGVSQPFSSARWSQESMANPPASAAPAR